MNYRQGIALLILILAACAPDDLDITPTATVTPEPTARPTSTPVPEDFVDPTLANEEAITFILENIPDRMPAGAVEWKRDYTRGEEGIEDIPRAENGYGAKVFYTEQTGGQMNLTFAQFATAEDATNHYEFIRGIRQPLETGDANDTLPQPNIFGSGLYGSVAIFQIDDTFIEVNIELFSSTQGNPLVPLARETIRYFEELQSELEAGTASDDEPAAEDAPPEDTTNTESATNAPLLDAILEELPAQIMGDAIWTRDFERFDGLQILDNFNDDPAMRVFYREQTGGALQMTFAVMEGEEAATIQYERFKGIREGLEEENNREGFPEPHVFGQGLYGSVAILQVGDVFIEVLIERAPGTIANPLEAIARTALQVLDNAQARLAG